MLKNVLRGTSAYTRFFLREFWWAVRGVGTSDYRKLCTRCRRTGQAHWSMVGCRRFR